MPQEKERALELVCEAEMKLAHVANWAKEAGLLQLCRDVEYEQVRLIDLKTQIMQA